MYLKFHINTPYIVYVIKCILTHTFFFLSVYIVKASENNSGTTLQVKRWTRLKLKYVFQTKMIENTQI